MTNHAYMKFVTLIFLALLLGCNTAANLEPAAESPNDRYLAMDRSRDGLNEYREKVVDTHYALAQSPQSKWPATVTLESPIQIADAKALAAQYFDSVETIYISIESNGSASVSCLI